MNRIDRLGSHHPSGLGRSRLALAVACSACVTFIIGYWPLQLSPTRWVYYLADDAFYYQVVARRFASQGISSFDGITLTNGYQPLWQAVVAVQFLLSSSIAPIVLCEWVAVLLAVFLICRAIAAHDTWMLPLLAALLVGLVTVPLVFSGMESSILFLAFAGFLLGLQSAAQSESTRTFPLAVLASLTIAARLDAAVFVVPTILLAPLSLRRKISVLLVVAVLGSVYAAMNQILFGTWLPISGRVKSLGGGHPNWVLLGQLTETWSRDESPVRAALAFARSTMGRTLYVAGMTAVLTVALPHRRAFAGRVALGLLFGLALFAARLVYFSSWAVWDWYAFPIFFFLAVDVFLIATLLKEPHPLRRLVAVIVVGLLLMASSIFTVREALLAVLVLSIAWMPWWRDLPIARRATASLGIVLTIVGAYSVINAPPPPTPPEVVTAQSLAAQVSVVTGRAPVAMGDYAGAFAWFYDGSVHQLEGLVNDREYLDRVQKRQPLEPLLCARGVRFIASFQPELGAYETFDYRPFRPVLTTFDGPIIRVSKVDEVAKLADPSRRGGPEVARILYVWRMPGCRA